jgi:hypothetical protein
MATGNPDVMEFARIGQGEVGGDHWFIAMPRGETGGRRNIRLDTVR